MDVFTKHALAIARATMVLTCFGALILGPEDHIDAAKRIKRYTGRRPKLSAGCDCAERRAARKP